MTVELNVVGVFYTKAVDIGPPGQKTVKDVMDLAVRQSTDPLFRYSSIDSGLIVNSILAFHTTDFISRSGRKYAKGIYSLGQTFTEPTPNPYSVWQYYLFDATGKRVPVKAETSYTVSTVQDGWKIVWRLVTICNSPTGLSRRMEKILPPDSLSLEMF